MAFEAEDKPRGLWNVMRKGHSSPAEAPVEERPSAPAEANAPDEAGISFGSEEIEPAEADAKPASGKGLWSVMGVRTAVPAESPPKVPVEVESPAPPPTWFRGKVETEPAPEPATITPPTRAEAPEETPPAAPLVHSRPVIQPRPMPRTEPEPFIRTEVETPAQEKLASLTKKTGRSRGAMWSFLVGLFAIPLTLLAMRPEIWTRIPAALVGFGALVLGLISFSEIQRSRGRQTGKGLSMLGMLLGTIAMFLGPLVIAPWSKNQKTQNTRSITRSHLEQIGTALKKYHAGHDQFPPGGTYRVEETGETTPLHSWMTELLPYLDANDVYHDIRFEDPWDEPMNKPPMGRKIPAFFAGGVEETHNQAGYGLSHFAGVGGQVETPEGQYVNAGIFERSSNVRQSDIADGLSQTLVAGEIPDGYRPWGEPGNWRIIGEGLNRDTGSFGNAQRTGAMFLKADGSVQFFSNSVSPDVLRRLSTRDGEDNRMIPENYR